MLLPRKWALSLGLLVAVPSLTVAAPLLDFMKPSPAKAEAAAQTPEQSNQEVADEIGKALGQARLVYKDVQIEYLAGVATIKGQIKDTAQRASVTKIVSKVPGVNTVENRLTLMEATVSRTQQTVQSAAATAHDAATPVQHASLQGSAHQRVQQVNLDEQPAVDNQAVAQDIANALTTAGLSGYDIEVRYRNGVASLLGGVEDQSQVVRAHQAAASVPGVTQVLNRLSVKGQPGNVNPTAAMGPMGQPMGPMQGQPMMGPPPGYPVQQAQGMAPGMAGPDYRNIQPAGHHLYNQPNLPQNAWPSYAPYDNSAAVTYPSQYDASAWPYIGPYYPYPQVPLGWRKSTLEWNDGSWSLKFDSKTDRWWWFLNPHNWN